MGRCYQPENFSCTNYENISKKRFIHFLEKKGRLSNKGINVARLFCIFTIYTYRLNKVYNVCTVCYIVNYMPLECYITNLFTHTHTHTYIIIKLITFKTKFN